MARPREFETEEAIEKAMLVFWDHGYHEASLPDLLDGMGLTRGSLYKAFKDKKNLFLLVLDHYEAAAVEKAVALLTGADIPDGKDRILTLFGRLVDAVRNGDHRGCLLCTAAASSATDDTDIARSVHGGLAKIQSALETALAQAPSLNDLDPVRRSRLADVLLTQYIGLRTLARANLPLGVLEKAVAGIEDILDAAAG